MWGGVVCSSIRQHKQKLCVIRQNRLREKIYKNSPFPLIRLDGVPLELCCCNSVYFWPSLCACVNLFTFPLLNLCVWVCVCVCDTLDRFVELLFRIAKGSLKPSHQCWHPVVILTWGGSGVQQFFIHFWVIAHHLCLLLYKIVSSMLDWQIVNDLHFYSSFHIIHCCCS